MTDIDAKEEKRPFQFGIMSLLKLTTVTALVMSGIATVGGYALLMVFVVLFICFSSVAYFAAPFTILLLYALMPRFGRRCVAASCAIMLCFCLLAAGFERIVDGPRWSPAILLNTLTSWLLQTLFICIMIAITTKIETARRRKSMKARRRLLPDKVPPPQPEPELYPATLNEQKAID